MRRILISVVLASLTACAGTHASVAGATTSSSSATGLLSWVTLEHVKNVVDLAWPGAGGVITVAANGLLWHLSPSGTLSPFAQGPGGYKTALGPEPYIALVPATQPAADKCPFVPDSVFALMTGKQPGVVTVDGSGHVRAFTKLPTGETPNGIALDEVGHFGYRLLVSARLPKSVTIFAIDCKGVVSTVASSLPLVEGGIVVAPPSFGKVGGDLIAPSELTGDVYEIDPHGHAAVLVPSGLPHGADIGVESAGFVPPGFQNGSGAYVSDRVSPKNPHPGTDSVLLLTGAALLAAGVRPGDLIVVSEGAAETIVVHCATSCTARHIANGYPISHGEGHVVFTSPAIK